MPSQRFLSTVIAASLLAGLVGCGGVTQFNGGTAFAISGTPAAPPPPPPPPPKEEPKPPARVELRDNKIEFKEKIQFEVNKSVIKPESYGLLKEIADVIKKNPQVKKISIEGHASAEGDAKRNKTLSDERAKAVMNHLVTKEGVEAGRMVAKGWGVEKPIAPNDTEENREKNRRVEFLVIEQDVTQKKVEIDPKTGQEKVVEEKKESIKAPEATPPAGTEAGKKPDAKKPDAKKPEPPKEAPKKPEGKK
jgi:OOP family OmpA-OmpF porin